VIIRILNFKSIFQKLYEALFICSYCIKFLNYVRENYIRKGI